MFVLPKRVKKNKIKRKNKKKEKIKKRFKIGGGDCLLKTQGSANSREDV